MPLETQDILLGRRILLVEDEGITQMQLQRICKLAGLDLVGVAKNGLKR